MQDDSETKPSEEQLRDVEEEGALTQHRTCCSATVKQVLCALVVSASLLEVGLVIGWPAVLPDLQQDNSSAFNITGNDVKWLVACMGITGMTTNVFTGMMMECLGPRHLLSLLLLPASGFWMLQAFSPNLPIFYIGRIGGSCISHVFSTLSNPLISELVEPHLRGMLSCLPELIVSAGVLIVYTLCYLLPWQLVTGLCAVPFLPLFCLSLMVPESPFWLLRKGKLEEAERSLKRLRDPRQRAITNELFNIQMSIMKHTQATIYDQIKQLAVGHNAKPIILLVTVFILRELGGQYAVFSYTVYLFQRAGVDLDVFTCTILVGVVRLLSTMTTSFIVDRVGRRPLLLGTTIVCFTAEAIGGLFLLADVSGVSWIPLVAILVYVSAYGLGMGPIPWILMGELLPTPVRSIGASMCAFNFAATQFVVGYIFPELMGAVGVGGTLLVFAGANFILSIIIWVFLPETRGQSLHKLQDAFSSLSSKTTFINMRHL